MVRIPGPEQVQRVGASTTRGGAIRADASSFGADIGRSLQQGAGEGVAVLEDLTRKENARRLNEARTGAYAALKQVEFDLEDDRDYETLQDRYEVQSKAIKEEFSKDLRGDTLEAFNLAFEQSNASIGLNVQGMARSGIRERGAASFESNLTQLRETMADAGNDAEFQLGFDMAREMLASGVEAGYFTQQAGQEALDGWVNNVRRDQATRMIINDPELAVDVLEADDLDGLQESDRLTLLKQAKVQQRILEAERKREAAEQRAILRGRVNSALKDEIASVRRTGKGQGLVSADQIRAAYADDPDRANDILRQLDAEAAFYETRQQIALTPLSEDLAILEANAPEGEGFAEEAERQDLLIEAVREKRKALANDPAGYIFRASPAIAQEFQAAETPEQMRGAIDTMLTEQERLGLPRYARRALSDGQAEDLVTRYAGQEDAQGRADFIRAQSEVYGEHWPSVYGEMVDAGLPGGAIVLAGMTGPGQQRAAVALAEAQQEGAKALKDAIGKEAAGEVADATRLALADFDATMAATPGGGQIANLYRENVALLAMDYVRSGDSPADAAERAAADVVNSRYSFHETYRVPVEFDGGMVEQRARFFRESRLGTLDLEVPPSMDARLPEEAARKQYLDALADKGYWLTNRDETGLILMNEQGETVVLETGEPVEILFGEVEGLPDPSVPADIMEGASP